VYFLPPLTFRVLIFNFLILIFRETIYTHLFILKERKLQIIKAADKRFSKHGLGKTTLDEIARDLRIGKATIYHYFDTKEDLFFETISWETDQIIEEIKSIFNNEEVELRERFLNYFNFKTELHTKYQLVYEILLLLLKDSSLERESLIINQLIKREEEIINLALNYVYAKKIESMPASLPMYFVMQSWGRLFGNKLTDFITQETQPFVKELFFNSIENILK